MPHPARTSAAAGCVPPSRSSVRKYPGGSGAAPPEALLRFGAGETGNLSERLPGKPTFGTPAKRILFGSCKRSADKHTGASLAKSRAHIESFLSTKLGANYRRYEQIHYAFAPVIGVDRRHEISTHGFVPKDFLEFAQAVMTKKTFRNTTSYARNTLKVKIFTLGSKLLVMLN